MGIKAKIAPPKITKPGYYKMFYQPARCDECNEILDGVAYVLFTNMSPPPKKYSGERFCEACYQSSNTKVNHPHGETHKHGTGDDPDACPICGSGHSCDCTPHSSARSTNSLE